MTELDRVGSPQLSPQVGMTSPVNRREGSTPNEGAEPDIAMLLDRVCAQLPHEYTKQLVRDVVRLKLAMGFERDVRSYLKRRSGEYPAIIGPPESD